MLFVFMGSGPICKRLQLLHTAPKHDSKCITCEPIPCSTQSVSQHYTNMRLPLTNASKFVTQDRWGMTPTLPPTRHLCPRHWKIQNAVKEARNITRDSSACSPSMAWTCIRLGRSLRCSHRAMTLRRCPKEE